MKRDKIIIFGLIGIGSDERTILGGISPDKITFVGTGNLLFFVTNVKKRSRGKGGRACPASPGRIQDSIEGARPLTGAERGRGGAIPDVEGISHFPSSPRCAGAALWPPLARVSGSTAGGARSAGGSVRGWWS